MKYLLLVLVIFVSSCDSRTTTHMVDITIATDLCKNSDGVKKLSPIVTDQWKGTVYCNNGATFIYDKNGVVK